MHALTPDFLSQHPAAQCPARHALRLARRAQRRDQAGDEPAFVHFAGHHPLGRRARRSRPLARSRDDGDSPAFRPIGEGTYIVQYRNTPDGWRISASRPTSSSPDLTKAAGGMTRPRWCAHLITTTPPMARELLTGRAARAARGCRRSWAARQRCCSKAVSRRNTVNAFGYYLDRGIAMTISSICSRRTA